MFCIEDNRNTSVYVFITKIFWKKLQQLDQVIFYVQMDRAIKTGVSREMILQKWFILAFYLEDNRNTSVYVFSTEIIWVTFDSIIEKS